MEDDYVVTSRLVVRNDTGAGLGGVERQLGGIERRVVSLGDTMARIFAFTGGIAGIGAMMKGVVSLSSEIDDAQRGMATIFNALTQTPIDRAFRVARSEVALLSEDAKRGAGELSDYIRGYNTILAPAMQAGATLDEIRRLNRLSVTVGSTQAEGVALTQRDVLQGLSGNVSQAETPILARALATIRMDFAAFRRLDQRGRFDALSRAFGNFEPGVALLGQSWSAQLSTLQDNIKAVVRQVSAPIFERWTSELRSVNDWFARNSAAIEETAEVLGGRMLRVWDDLIGKAGVYAGLAGAAFTAPRLVGVADLLGGRGAAGIAAGALGGAGPLALVGGAIAVTAGAVWGAVREWPGLFTRLGEAAAFAGTGLGGVASAFGDLFGPGSPLNLVGGGILWGLGNGLYLVGLAFRGLAIIVELFATGLRGIGIGLLEALPSSLGGISGLEAARRRDTLQIESLQTLARLYGYGSEGATAPDEADQARLNRLPDQNVNLNGPITISVKAEVNEDPARVALAFDEFLGNINRFRTQARRGVRAPNL